MNVASVKIETFHRTPDGGARVSMRLRNAHGRTMTRQQMTWTADELDHFMSLASTQELIRAAMRERLGKSQ